MRIIQDEDEDDKIRMIKDKDNQGVEFAEKIALRNPCSKKGIKGLFPIEPAVGNSGSSLVHIYVHTSPRSTFCNLAPVNASVAQATPSSTNPSGDIYVLKIKIKLAKTTIFQNQKKCKTHVGTSCW